MYFCEALSILDTFKVFFLLFHAFDKVTIHMHFLYAPLHLYVSFLLCTEMLDDMNL